MEHEIFLYPYSKAEAGRRGELDRWEESFRANVSCAREIEAAIRGYSNVDGILQPGAAQSILNQWGFKRTNFVLANTLQQLGPIKDRLSEANRNWQCGAYIPQDGTNRYFAVPRSRQQAVPNCASRLRRRTQTGKSSFLKRRSADRTMKSLPVCAVCCIWQTDGKRRESTACKAHLRTITALLKGP